MIALRLGTVMAEGTPAEVLGNRDVVDALLGGASEAVVSRSLTLERAAGAESRRGGAGDLPPRGGNGGCAPGDEIQEPRRRHA